MNAVEEWGNEWDMYADSEGYDSGYSVFALRWFMLILFDRDAYDRVREKHGTRAYYREYYQRNREKIKKRAKVNFEKLTAKYGTTPSEYMKKYREENRGRIAVLGMRSRDRIKERERLKKARGEE